jgi:hypothetical protein
VNPGLLLNELRKTFEDWDGLLVNPRYCRNDRAVCWTSFNGGRLTEPVTSEQVLGVLDQKQFSFQSAEDGSIFQLLYRFDSDDKLIEARLAFYLLRSRGSLEDGYAEVRSTAWIRLDYDTAAAAGLLHTACHLHLHGFPETRIPVDGVPGPRQFVEFIIAACYPDYYRMHRLESGNEPDNALIQTVNACMIRLPGPRPVILHLGLPEAAQHQ